MATRILKTTAFRIASTTIATYASIISRNASTAKLPFKTISETDLSFFKSVLDASGIVDPNDTDTLNLYNNDWMGRYKGASKTILRPKTTLQVSQILKYCNTHSIAIVPQGGNTGLVGGSVPLFDEVILSTQYMNTIRHFDEVSGVLQCDAGCVLENLDNWLKEKGYMMPLDLGAKGSCQIGGNVATNAGGLRLLRYGSLHGTVLALEVVLADGTIMNLGIITGITILTPPKPKSTNVALLVLDSYDAVQQTFKLAKRDLGEILSAFEFWDRESMDLVLKYTPSRDPFTGLNKFYVLIETSGSNQDHDDEKLAVFLEDIMTNEVVLDGVLAQDTTQFKNFWEIRESIPVACAKEGGMFKYDLSVPLPLLYNIVTEMREKLHDLCDINGKEHVKSIVGFGHAGDCNLHLNIMTTGYTPLMKAAIEPYIYERIKSYNGSISAEHGVGIMKAGDLYYSQSKDSVNVMRRIKSMFDPKGILNPYKFFPKSENQ